MNNINFTKLIAELEALITQVPGDQRPEQEKIAFAQHLQQILLNAFNLTSDMISLSQQELKALANYLYANDLIIKCKQAAVRVSPQTWEAIEARMLLVPGS